MESKSSPEALSRREFVRTTSALVATSLAGGFAGQAAAVEAPGAAPVAGAVSPPGVPVWPRPLLTKADDFHDVSRGKPKPFTLDRRRAGARRGSRRRRWRLEIVADPFTSER